jgi:hypothetical protein
MSAASIRQMADRIAALVEERLRLPRKNLDTAHYLLKAQRHVPKAVADELRVLAEAVSLTGDANAVRRVDYERLSTAYETCMRHLGKLPAGIRRKRFLAEVSSNLWVNLSVFVLVLAGVWFLFLR